MAKPKPFDDVENALNASNALNESQPSPPQDFGVCPEQSSSWLSRITFKWVSPLLVRGCRSPLKAASLWKLHHNESVEFLHQKYVSLRGLKNSGNIFTDVELKLWRIGKPALVPSAALMAVYSFAQLSEPLIVREIVKSIQNKTVAGAYYCVALFIVSIFGAFCNQYHLHLAYRTGQRMRTIIISEVFRKAMSLSGDDRNKQAAGQLVNLVANDSQKVYELMQLVNLLWSAPAQLIFAVYFLVNLLGVSALAGYGHIYSLLNLSLHHQHLCNIF
jgi:hypothetical protein